MSAAQPAPEGTADHGAIPRRPASGRRLLEIVRQVSGVNVRARMEYRFDFAAYVLFGIVYHLAALAFVWVVLTQTGGLGDWTTNEVLFLIGLRLIAHGIFELVFGNLQYVSELVREGWFDRYLVRPINPLLQVLLHELRINGVGDIVFGLGVFAVANAGLHLDWSLASFAYLGLVICGAVLLEVGMTLAISAVSFWLVQTDALMWWAGDIVNTFGNYPLSIFPSAARFVFTFAFPIAFLSFFPASVFLGRAEGVPFTPLFAYGAPLIGLVAFVAAYRLWQVGLNHHRSTGT